MWHVLTSLILLVLSYRAGSLVWIYTSTHLLFRAIGNVAPLDAIAQLIGSSVAPEYSPDCQLTKRFVQTHTQWSPLLSKILTWVATRPVRYTILFSFIPLSLLVDIYYTIPLVSWYVFMGGWWSLTDILPHALFRILFLQT